MNIAQQLIEVLDFLQKRRPGYRYSICIKNRKTNWIVSVVGESMEDKSYPHDFVQCESTDFEQLPVIVKNKASELLLAEIKKNEETVERLRKQNSTLEEEASRLRQLLAIHN